MTKSELKTGMIVTLRNGEEYVFIKDFVVNNDYVMESCNDGVLVNGDKPSWAKMTHYDNDLKQKDKFYKDLDVMKVEIANHPYAFTIIPYNKRDRQLLWKREEPKQMTVAEIEAILGYKVEIVSEK